MELHLLKPLYTFKAVLSGIDVEETFITAISPSNIEFSYENRHYPSDEEYLTALADALRVEYKAIVDAGFLLQIDNPRMATHYNRTPDASIEDCRRFIALRVEAVNHALRGIPEDRVRFHTCYSVNIAPRVHDLELKHFVDLMLEIRAGAYSIEAANPRHEHEWQVWQDVKLPDGKVLIPGVVSHCIHLVEHPDLVAQRLIRFADVVGRENVIASTDCGFDTSRRPETSSTPMSRGLSSARWSRAPASRAGSSGLEARAIKFKPGCGHNRSMQHKR